MTAAAPPKGLYVKTYGCQMNVYDSERMADVLRPLGYAMVDAPGDADLVVLNTCHIREKASEKVYAELGRLKAIKRAREERGDGGTTVVVAGCVAQAEGQEIMTRAPVVDLVVGPQAYHRLPELIATASRARGERLAVDFAPEAKFDALGAQRQVAGPTAFLTVQEGCDKFCTFCVVPYTRGAEWGRPAAAVIAEAEGLAAKGVRELTLLGQNVNAYAAEGPDGKTWSLARLIRRLAEIEGVERLRYTTSHPTDFSEDLIAAHAEVPQLMPYLHLPVQSGSDRILRAMNRKHTAEAYLKLVERVRGARPDIALTSDLIVGFPGETEKDFDDTLRIVESANYATSFTFSYSRRPGTPASAMPGQVAEEVKADRLKRLQTRILERQTAFNASQVGRTLPVLFDKRGRNAGQVGGRSPFLQAVHGDGPEALIGRVATMRIVAASQNSLTGVLA